MITDEEIIEKYKNGGDITVEEYERYMALGIPEEESEPLGMYGKILDKLIEEHCWIKSVVMGADYYDFLLSIDKLFDIKDEHGLLEYCIKNPNVATSSAILVLDCFGLRLSELKSIEIIDDKWLQCETSKERKGRNVVLRKIPITPWARALMPYIDIDKARDVNPSSVESTFYRRFKGKYSPHDLRHTFVSRCNACYVKEELISIWAGHSLNGNTTTKVYTHFTDEFQLKEAEKVVAEWVDLVPNESRMVQFDQQNNIVNVSILQ